MTAAGFLFVGLVLVPGCLALQIDPAEAYMSSRLRELEAQRGQFWHLPEGAASRAIQQSEPTSTSLPDGDQGAPIRVHLEYDLASAGLSPTQEANLRTVIAAARREVQRLLTLRRPVESRLYIDPPCADIRDGNCYYVGKEKYCYTARHNNTYFGWIVLCAERTPPVCYRIKIGDGIPDTDFILYVTAASSLPDGSPACTPSARAAGGWCEVSAEDGRPTAGFLNWCEGVAELESLSNFPHLVDTAIHEILHAMGFSRPLFSLFREADGSPVSGADMLLRWPVGPENATAVRTPSVSLAAALHFACYPEPGVALETAGGGSTVGSHWSQLVVPEDLMTGVQWSGGARQRITHFTAAFFNDTGWYEVDFSRAAPASFGRNARCSFLSGVSAESCATRPIPDILSDWFVEAGAGYSCTPDLLSVGSPSELELYPGCNQVRPVKSLACQNPAVLTSRSGLLASAFGVFHGPRARCIRVAAGSRQARAVEEASGVIDIERVPLGADCMKMECTGVPGKYELFVEVLGALIRCPSNATVKIGGAGSLLNAGLSDTTIGPCPDNEVVCSGLTCPEDCSGNGVCHQGSCQCFPGFIGDSCDKRECGACDLTFETCDADSQLCVGERHRSRADALASLAGSLLRYYPVPSKNTSERPPPEVVMGTVSHAYLASCPVILDSDGDGAFTHRDLAIAPRAVSLSADHGRFRAVAWGILRAPVLMPCPSTSGTFADRCQGCNDTATGLPPAFPFLSSWVAVEAAPPQPSPAPTASPAPSPDAGGDAVEPTDTPVPGTETPGTGTVTPPEPDGVATPAAQEDVVVDTATPNPTSMIDPNAVRAVEALHDMHRHLLLGPLSTAVTEIVLRSRLSSTDETSWWSEAQATVAAASCLGVSPTVGSGALAPDWIPQPALSASFTRGVEPVTLVVAFGEADALAHVRTASTLSAVAECAAAALTEMESDKARVGSLLVQAAADICYVSGGAAGALDLTSAQFVRDLLRDTQGRTARVRPRNGVDLESLLDAAAESIALAVSNIMSPTEIDAAPALLETLSLEHAARTTLAAELRASAKGDVSISNISAVTSASLRSWASETLALGMVSLEGLVPEEPPEPTPAPETPAPTPPVVPPSYGWWDAPVCIGSGCLSRMAAALFLMATAVAIAAASIAIVAWRMAPERSRFVPSPSGRSVRRVVVSPARKEPADSRPDEASGAGAFRGLRRGLSDSGTSAMGSVGGDATPFSRDGDLRSSAATSSQEEKGRGERMETRGAASDARKTKGKRDPGAMELF